MMNWKPVYMFFIWLTFIQSIQAQDQMDIVFGKITPVQFRITSPKFDTGANAVVIADIGKMSFEGNHNGWFIIVLTRFIRVKIMRDSGIREAVNRIELMENKDGNEEKLVELKGITYNLENGSIQYSNLQYKEVQDESINKYRHIKKFTMPDLRAGSVYDISYTIRSNFLSDPPEWKFQGSWPCLWSEFQATIPDMFHYLIKTRGGEKYDIKTTKSFAQSYTIKGSGGDIGSDNEVNLSCTNYQTRWVKKNVPALKELTYSSSIHNYESGIFFVLEYFKLDERYGKDLELRTWKQECHRLLKKTDFGLEINQNNKWMDQELKQVTSGLISTEEEIKEIFQLIRGNYHCTDSLGLYINTSLKEVYKLHSGNVAELNLLLVAMLRHRNILADPAILSTRQNGIVTKNIPLINEYNYVIGVVNSGERLILLDVSQPYNAYGKLPPYCYNGTARRINEDHTELIDLSPDSVEETKSTQAIVIQDEKGMLSGTVKTIYGTNDSYDIRERVKQGTVREYLSNTVSFLKVEQFNEGYLKNLDKPELPLIMDMDLNLGNPDSSDEFRIGPVLYQDFKTNPFVSSDRLCPVEFPFKIDNTYLLSMEIPKGFQVDELPKSARVKLNENQGMFEYLIQKNPDNIQMRVHLKLNQATFATEEYATLRDFFAYVVKKESEQIVFKKIK